ncbi:Mce-associated membrane protein [Prauserella isguenensis]|uniref:Mce-associated membrane protein n=1 Tax=Prauserella isguenensis TaxID=1470180 RepID=A0A839S7H3_9PSEU|nr:hypothetical protein [Prauserella isguenensis]MBB3052669.1 Mce-associated membrane protein [Prauserella isguenensis]
MTRRSVFGTAPGVKPSGKCAEVDEGADGTVDEDPVHGDNVHGDNVHGDNVHEDSVHEDTAAGGLDDAGDPDDPVDTDDPSGTGAPGGTADPGDDATPDRRRRSGSRRATVLAVLAALCVVAVAGAIWLGVQAGGAVSDDVAHVDGTRTRQVTEQIGSAVTAVFSYDRGDLARTERAADRMLTGAARREYDATFARLREQADGSGAVQSTTVRSVGVRSLEGDRAELLVLADRRVLDQDMRSRGSHAVWIDVVAVHTDGGWRIAEMSPM